MLLSSGGGAAALVTHIHHFQHFRVLNFLHTHADVGGRSEFLELGEGTKDVPERAPGVSAGSAYIYMVGKPSGPAS